MRKQTWSWALAANVLILALITRADLPPYQLDQIENDDFRGHTLAQAMTLLKVSEADLAPFRCDGKQEFTLLPELLHPKAEGNSLRIQVPNPDYEDYGIYRDGVLYKANGKKPAGGSLRNDSFVAAVLDAIAKLEALPTGKTLLSRLEHSPYVLTIRYGTPHFWPDDDARSRPTSGMMMAQAIQLLNTLRWPEYGNQFNRIGAGGEINFDPKLASEFTEDDGVKRPAAAHTVLAHEMFHAFDGIRGLLDRRQMNGDAYEFTEVTEYRATYMENQIRSESGLHYRKFYGDGTHGSLLGTDGKPMLIPAPCLGAGTAN